MGQRGPEEKGRQGCGPCWPGTMGTHSGLGHSAQQLGGHWYSSPCLTVLCPLPLDKLIVVCSPTPGTGRKTVDLGVA